jgi:hypothetical protein
MSDMDRICILSDNYGKKKSNINANENPFVMHLENQQWALSSPL